MTTRGRGRDEVALRAGVGRMIMTTERRGEVAILEVASRRRRRRRVEQEECDG